MKNQLCRKLGKNLAFLGSTVLLMMSMMGNANALLFDCGPVAGNVSGSSDCQISDATQDNLTDPMTVNTEGFFDITNWISAGKTEFVEGYSILESGDTDIGFSASSSLDMLSGNWSISGDAWSAWENIILVFKNGNGTSIVGYLLDGISTSGTWLSPFESSIFEVSNTHAVSHITAYVSGPVSVAEPETFALLAIGLLGFAASRKRLKK